MENAVVAAALSGRELSVTALELEELNVFLMHDIKEKMKEMKKAHEEYIQSYKDIIDNMPMAIFMGDKHEQTVYINQLFSELSKYHIDEVLGKKSHMFFTKESQTIVEKQAVQRRKGKKSVYECEFLSKDGERIPVSITSIPLANGGSVAMMMDLREYRTLEKERKHLEEVNHLKDDFINVASHELRTPLTSIKGYLSMMLDGDF